MWRLIFASLIFLLSLLVLFKAPTNFFWKVAIAVTEYPYIFLSLSLICFVVCIRTDSYRTPVLILTTISFILYLFPIARVYSRGSKLAEEFNKYFPPQNQRLQLQRPFSVPKMFSGIGITKVIPQTFTYKALSERNLDLDFYPAHNPDLPADSKSPCVIVIHGGSWSEGDSKQLSDLNSYLANHGYHVAAINYRLAPKYKSPAPVEDTQEAIHYLVKHSHQLSIDTTNLVLLGRSAGGQIALVAAYSSNDVKIKGVIAMYAPADMVWGAHIKANKLVLNTDKVFTDYLGGLIGELPLKYESASPIEYVNKKSTPTLIIHGDLDAMVSFEHSVHLNKKLNENGVKHYFLNIPGATHGCDYNINGPSGQITTFAIERFINSVTTK